MKFMKRIIAIDGPSGSGKTTVALLLARELKGVAVFSGLLYRGIARYIKKCDELNCITESLNGVNIDFMIDGNIMLWIINGILQDKESLEDPDIANRASNLSRYQIVRNTVNNTIRRAVMYLTVDVIVEGRDIGTVVFPDAWKKFFLDASVEERAKRRYLQLQSRGVNVDYNEIFKEQYERDKNDSSRDIAPLRPASDAIVIDTTARDVTDVLKIILSYLLPTS